MSSERQTALELATEFDQRHGLHRCCTFNCSQGRKCVLRYAPARPVPTRPGLIERLTSAIRVKFRYLSWRYGSRRNLPL